MPRLSKPRSREGTPSESGEGTAFRSRRLPEEQRLRLKEPLGRLFRGDPERTMKELARHLGKCDPKRVIAVGDATVANMIRYDLKVDVFIVDNRVMRKPSEPVKVVTDEVLRIRNPAATITAEAWNAISRAVRGEKTVKVEVEGEEDLLALPAIICAPQGSVVVYGQPGEGVVAVRVTRNKKAEARRLVDDMPHEED